ncbi:MAG: hypothetical protein F4077_03685 [Gammaproteobacteria bacterium]|nr:hypothetical protein [Gammaproteobacteria bacterium]
MLSVALTFLIVHPGLYSTVNAHVDPITNIGSAGPDALFIQAYALYPMANCHLLHNHRVHVRSLATSINDLKRNDTYGARRLLQDLDTMAITQEDCISLCPLHAGNYLNCYIQKKNLNVAALDLAALATGAPFVIPVVGGVVSAVLGVASAVVGIISLFTRCNWKRPDSSMCPDEHVKIEAFLDEHE